MAPRFVFLFFIGGIIRFLIIIYPWKLQWLLDSVSISTPLNSWKRVTEGIFLYKRGISPYSGNIYHETPIFLLMFELLSRAWQFVIPLVFVICDLITALVLSKLAEMFGRNLLTRQKHEVKQYNSDATKLMLKPADVAQLHSYVATLYLFHPYGVLSCAAMTTTVFANLILALSLFFAMKGYSVLMCAFLALATYQNFYPAMLIFPCAFYISKNRKTDAIGICKSFVILVIVFAMTLATLFFASFHILGNWDFINSVYGCILNVDDLTPNIGLFWYFFTEMFDHFRTFFIYTFQINAFIYVIPLMIRFPNDPMLVTFTLQGLICIFKSYPSIGDIALYTSLLPIWSHLYPFMRQTFIIGCFFLVCSILAPVLFQLWIFYGSANANFFFGITLAFNAAQIFLITDILFAYVKREYHLRNGLTLKVEGEQGKLVLK